MDMSKLEKYLERIHYSGAVEADINTLKRIHQLHPAFIPFENIDSYTGKVPSLDADDVFRKLVSEERGGYCYEQNLLLNEILIYIGFKAEIKLARVLWKKDENSKTARTHMLQIVELGEQKYLVDCGFGTVTLTSPLLLDNGEPQTTPNGQFRISRKDNGYTLYFWKETWLPVYRFVLDNVEYVDLEIANWYVATHPQSGFRKNLILSKVDEKARYTFVDHVLNIRYSNGEKVSSDIESNHRLFEMLENVFGLKENAVEMLKHAGH